MAVIAATVATVILAALAALQVCVAAGAPWGRFVWGGRHRILPRRLRVGSAASVLFYAVFAGILLSRAGVLPGDSSPVVDVAAWVLFGYFTLGIVMNLASRRRAERWSMAPTCLVLACLTAVVAVS